MDGKSAPFRSADFGAARSEAEQQRAKGDLLLSEPSARPLSLQLDSLYLDLQGRPAVEAAPRGALQRIATNAAIDQLRRRLCGRQRFLQFRVAQIQTFFKQGPHCLCRAQQLLMALFEGAVG